jgi:hypothetical protein
MDENYYISPKEEYVQISNLGRQKRYSSDCKFYGEINADSTNEYQVTKWYFDKRNSEE